MEKLTPEQQRKLDTIQALLRKAQAEGATPFEAESLSAKAFALAARYMIDEAFIQAKSGTTDTIMTRQGEVGRPYNQLMTLANVIYKFTGCKLIRRNADPDADIYDQVEGKAADGTRYRGEKFSVVGFTSDLDRGHMLLTSLLVQGTRQVTADYRRDVKFAQSSERRSTYYRSWWTEFTIEIYARLEPIRKQQMAKANMEHGTTTGSGAEVVLAARADLITHSINDQFGALKTGRKGRSVSGSGGDSGKEAGRRADIGGKRVSGSTRAIEG